MAVNRRSTSRGQRADSQVTWQSKLTMGKRNPPRLNCVNTFSNNSTRKLFALLSLPLTLASCAPALGGAAQHQVTERLEPAASVVVADGTYKATVLGLNDFHGQLEPSSFRLPDGNKVPAGGISALGGLLSTVRAESPNTVFVGVGDLTGASPLSSSLLADEPTVLAMNKLGMSINVLGNHELDYGLNELKRLQTGGCESVRADKACRFANPFGGAKYDYIAANVFDASGNRPFPAYRMVKAGDLNIAFVGAVLKDVPSVVAPAGIQGLTFRDEADSINAVLPEIRQKGADVVIALIHQGGTAKSAYDQVGCTNLGGPIVDVVSRLGADVSAIMTGHTHQAYNCVVSGRPVIQGASQGLLLQRLDLTVTRKSGQRTVAVDAKNVLVDSNKYSNTDMAALAAEAKAKTDPVANRVVATISATQITKATNASGESALGDVIADAQLAATRAADKGGAVIAFMNPGGIRADLPAKPSSTVTYGDIFAVQPFGNLLTVMTLKGEQIKTLLEQQFDNGSAGNTRILQVSEGFSYSYDKSRFAGQRVQSITLNGQPLDMARDYRITANSFLADGGDNFTVLKEGRDRLGGGLDVDALSAYLQTQGGKVVTEPQGRIKGQ